VVSKIRFNVGPIWVVLHIRIHNYIPLFNNNKMFKDIKLSK
jgi:hypothetical protein